MNQTITTKEQIETAFNNEVAKRRTALPLKQARFVACQQMVSDFKTGKYADASEAATEFLIEQEVAATGCSREAAEVQIKGILSGERTNWPPRDMGFRQDGNGRQID